MTANEPTTDEPERRRLAPRVKVWFEVGPEYSFGAGLIQILQAVDSRGSIKRAAGQLGRSYRHVWDRIKRAEAALGFALVETQVGGQGAHRSDLTAEARALILDFERLRARMIAALEADALGEPPPPPQPNK